MPKNIEGMFILLETGCVEGLKRWGDELQRRAIPAVISIYEHAIGNACSTIKNLSDRGFEVGGGYAGRPFWNEPYDYQYDQMRHVKDKIQVCTDRPMRVFNSAYFAYDKTTLEVADKLGVEYILARGTAGARAVTYQAEAYNAKIISVSNVPSKSTGTGSLCDYSLWARGEDPDDFRKILFSLRISS